MAELLQGMQACVLLPGHAYARCTRWCGSREAVRRFDRHLPAGIEPQIPVLLTLSRPRLAFRLGAIPFCTGARTLEAHVCITSPSSGLIIASAIDCV